MMTEELRIFPKSKYLLNRRLQELNDALEKNRLALEEITQQQDGDVMDDTSFRQARDQRELLETEVIKISRLMGSLIYELPNNLSMDTVIIGSRVSLKITYLDGVKDEVNLTIVGSNEARYLPSCIGKDENDVVISSESPIAEAILGKSVGAKSKFHAPDGEGDVSVSHIEVSNYLITKKS